MGLSKIIHLNMTYSVTFFLFAFKICVSHFNGFNIYIYIYIYVISPGIGQSDYDIYW